MTPLYTCNHFQIHELVPKIVCEERGEDAWRFLNPSLLVILDQLREAYGSIYCNTYAFKANVRKSFGRRDESGLRIPGQTNYRRDSDHTRGNAFDLLFAHVTARSVRADIISEYVEFDVPVVIECTIDGKEIGWLHIAVANTKDRVTQLHL